MEDYGFKFKIGDRVTLTECVRERDALNATLKADAYGRYTATLMAVRGRHLEECYGGIQRHYDCRIIHVPTRTVGNMEVSFAGDLRVGYVRVSEPELQLAEATEPAVGTV